MVNRVAGRPVWRRVCAVFAVIATLLAVLVAPQAAWAADDEPVNLNEDQKTLVSIGDANTGASYKLDKASVKDASSSYIVVQVDSGYFTPAAAAPTGSTAVDALDSTGAYVKNASTAVAAGGKYSYITFKSTDGAASITPESLQTYLRGLTFTTSGDTKQNITVNAMSTSLKVRDLSGADTAYNVTLYDNHAYTYVTQNGTWATAYAAAKGLTVLNTKGHLLTIESDAEHNLVCKSFGNKSGWIGGTRYTSAARMAEAEPDTFDATSDGSTDFGQNWYWATGPSRGTMFWQGVDTSGEGVDGVYVNWNTGEPNAWAGLEGYAEYGNGSLGQWNDYNATDKLNGFYVEFEGFDPDEAGATASAAVQRVNVSYDLDSNKVTSTTTDTKILTNDADFSTTLAAVEGRTLDTSSVKVTVGGQELAAGNYTFDSSTGKLTVPAAKVTGDVVVSAKVMRKVTFDVGTDGKMTDTATPTSLSVASGAKVSSATDFKQPDVTANTGKRFTGWLSSVDGVEGQMYESSAVGGAEVTSDMTFTAQYKDLVKVTFNYGGGKDGDNKESVSLTGVKDEEYKTPEGLSRTGYTFDAWDSEPSGTFGASDETFTAQWTANTYTVKFDKNDGTGEMADQSFTYDEVAKPLSENKFERAGYTFAGWKDEAANKTYTNKQEVQNLTAVNGGTVTLKAQWTANTDTAYKVEHWLENADDDGYTLDATDDKTGVTGADTAAAAKTTYAGFIAPATVAQSKIAGDGKTVVKIEYTRNKYDVTFDANGHGTAPDKVTGVKYEAKVAKPADDPSADGWSFGGWYTDAACADKDGWDFAESTMPAKNLTLYAKWTPNTDTAYKVEHWLQNANDDGYTLTATDDKAGATGARTDAEAKSYTGFTAPTEVTQSEIAGDGSTVVKIYYARNRYKLSFDANGLEGASMPASMEFKQGARLSAPAGEPSASGYVFGGWYTDASCGTVFDFTGTMPANDLTAYAKWTANGYTVKFVANGGKGGMADQSFTYGAAAKALSGNTFTRDGYTFAGWRDEASGKAYSDRQEVRNLTAVNGGTVTLRAQWTVNEYSITYDPDGGTLPADAPQKHTYGTETKLPTPSKDGYTFDGWYDEDGNKIDTVPADAKGTKVTAKWSANEYDITYDADGGTLPDGAPQKHTYGTETKLPTPSKDGYTFDGWYDENGNKVDTIPADAKGMKVTAKWTKNADNNNADDNGGNNTDSNTDNSSTDNADSGNNGTTYDPNGGVMPEGWTGADGRLPVPTRDGYRFDGWYDEDGNLVTSLEDAAGKTLHARWAKLDTLASTGATALAVGLTALALAAAGVTVAVLRRRRSR